MRIVLKYIVCILLLSFVRQVHAQQQEANIWYFGRFLGLDFNSGVAVPLNNGVINTTEGVATISDANGDLLFYTDGITVRNKLHQIMPNGSGLFGNVSSTQSAVVVPKIGDPNRYYIFTVDAQAGPRGLTYSIANMLLDGGNGDIETKNVSLQSNVVEKITAVRHCNNRDIWVVAHGVGSDAYYSFLVSPTGLNPTPVISNTGAVLPTTDSATLGYLKASPDGKRIAAAHFTVSADVSDFNNATGVVSNTYDLFLPTERHYYAYGIEFSPNSSLVYTTAFYTDPVNAQKRNILLQYDVTLPTPAAVRASKQIISTNADPIQTYAALQVAPDGKMYMAKNTYKHIAAINDPNVYGAGCGFVTNAIQYTLPSQSSSFGLPTFVQSYFFPLDSFTYTYSSICSGMKIDFNYNRPGHVSSILWNFGDPTSGANNSSTINNPSHQFSTPGTYTVMLIKYTNCGSDTLRRTVVADTVYSLGKDTIVCGGQNVLLNASAAGSSGTFLWQDGSTNPTLLATTAGIYWVETTTISGCTTRDSITVDFKPVPTFNLGTDTSLCQMQSLSLVANVSNANNYQWNTGATTSAISVSQPGIYWCEVTKDGCKHRDSLSILSIKPSPVVDLGDDLVLCEDITAALDASYPNSTYTWHDGSTDPVFTVSQAGTYFVELDLDGCKSSDTVLVDYTPKPVFTLGPDQFICPGNTIELNPPVDPLWQLTWHDGSTGPTYTVTQPGTYALTAINSCGAATDEIIVAKGVCKVYVPTAFTPNNDGLNDLFKILGTETVIKFELKVFNRWGEIMFQTVEKNRGWDGRWKGTTLDSGVFIYLLTYTDRDIPQPQTLKGTVTLIR